MAAPAPPRPTITDLVQSQARFECVCVGGRSGSFKGGGVSSNLIQKQLELDFEVIRLG